MADYRHTIGNMKHRVAICSMKDVVDSGGTLQLIRKEVYKCWADIYAVRSQMRSKEGYAIQENREYRSHVMRIRYRADITLTSAAWVYEERLKSAPRWFKVIHIADVDEDGRWLEIEARLVEESDFALKPADPVADTKNLLAPQPIMSGVKL